MKNKQYKPNIPTETQAPPARTQIAARKIEVATNDLHRISDTCIGINPAVSGNVPAAADNSRKEWRGVGEVEKGSAESVSISLTAPARI